MYTFLSWKASWKTFQKKNAQMHQNLSPSDKTIIKNDKSMGLKYVHKYLLNC